MRWTTLTTSLSVLLIVAVLVCGTTRPVVAALPQRGDIAHGLSSNNAALSMELLRGDAVMGGGIELASPWMTDAFIQSVEFDNLDGVQHNVHGNLLGVDFGPPPSGSGSIKSFATTVDPAPAGQLIGNTSPAPDNIGHAGNLTQTRLSSLSVSPENTKIAVVGTDAGTVIVYDYTPGNTKGAGAALANGRQTPLQTLVTGSTQGTAWLDNDTVLAFSSFGGLFEVDANTMAAQLKNSVDTPFIGSNYSALAYNKKISPYLYATYSGFNNSAIPMSQSRLFVFDPANNYSLVKEIDLSLSSQTAREIALDKDGNLFVGGFSGSIDFIADVVTNPAALTDNSSVDWYDSTDFSNFSGIDIGFALPVFGDYNDNGTVDAADYVLWRNGGPLENEGDNPGVVDQADYEFWRAHFGEGSGAGAALGTVAIPEPCSAVSLVIGVLGLLWGRPGRSRS